MVELSAAFRETLGGFEKIYSLYKQWVDVFA
jgi:hypothetical protein